MPQDAGRLRTVQDSNGSITMCTMVPRNKKNRGRPCRTEGTSDHLSARRHNSQKS